MSSIFKKPFLLSWTCSAGGSVCYYKLSSSQFSNIHITVQGKPLVVLLGAPPSLTFCYHPHSPSDTSRHHCVGLLSITSHSLRHQLGVVQFNSLVTLSTWRKGQIPQVKGSAPQKCSRPLQMPITNSRSLGYPHLLSDLATNWSVLWPSPQVGLIY